MTKYSYVWAIPFGLYYYVIFQLVYLARFGSLNMSFNVLDVSLLALGILSMVMLLYFANKLGGWKMLVIPLLIAFPFSAFGALSGGLHGVLGVLLFGLVPFAITLPIGYWLIKKFSSHTPPVSASMKQV